MIPRWFPVIQYNKMTANIFASYCTVASVSGESFHSGVLRNTRYIRYIYTLILLGRLFGPICGSMYPLWNLLHTC